MKESSVLGWMNAVMTECETTGSLSKPFRVDDYVCISDGHFLTAVRSAEECAVMEKYSPDTIRKILSAEPNGSSYPLAPLKAWALHESPKCGKCGSNRNVPCKECRGTGKCECICDCGQVAHDVECECCNSTGKVICECSYKSTPISVFGVTVNAALLEVAIRHLDGEFRVCARRNEKDSPLVLSGDGWYVAIMPLRTTEPPKKTYVPETERVSA